MDVPDVEILVHIAAPTTRAADVRYRNIARSYFEFDSTKRLELTNHPRTPYTSNHSVGLSKLSKDSGKSIALSDVTNHEEIHTRTISGTRPSSLCEVDQPISTADFFDAPQGTAFESSKLSVTEDTLIDERRLPSKEISTTKNNNTSKRAKVVPKPSSYGNNLGNLKSNRFRLTNSSSHAPLRSVNARNEDYVETSADIEDSEIADDGVGRFGCAIDLNSQLPLSFGLHSPPIDDVRKGAVESSDYSSVVVNAVSSRNGLSIVSSKDARQTEGRFSTNLRPSSTSDDSQRDTKMWTHTNHSEASVKQQRLYDFASLGKLEDSPSPETSTKNVSSLPSQLTPSLIKLKANSNVASRYRPKRIVGPIPKDIKGYWQFDTSGWPLQIQYEFWVSMREFLKRGEAGMATWMIRETSLNDESQLGIVSVWCWGELVEHIWLLLYVMSKGYIKKVPAIWYDGCQNLEILKMPVK